MKKYPLVMDWTLVSESTKLLVLSDETGNVGVVLDDKRFGDAQVLLMKIFEDEVRIKTTPHYIEHVSIKQDKTIEIEFAEFVKNVD